jgi:hypothetical protein
MKEVQEGPMKDMMLSSPTLAFIVGTRALLAAGTGLIIASRLDAMRRRRLGLACLAAGAATTLPALLAVRRGMRRADRLSSAVGYDPALKGSTRFPRRGDESIDADPIVDM